MNPSFFLVLLGILMIGVSFVGLNFAESRKPDLASETQRKGCSEASV